MLREQYLIAYPPADMRPVCDAHALTWTAGERHMIRLYCVGIHFNQVIDFAADTKSYVLNNGKYEQTGPVTFMSGAAILKAAADRFGLRYKLGVPGLNFQPQHVEYLSYTPTTANDPHPRVTAGGVFPFYGQPLSLIERLAPIGEISDVLQYTVQWPKNAAGPFPTPAPVTLNNTGQNDPNFPSPTKQDAAFGDNGFPDNCEIRLRLLSIYCTT